MATGGKKLEDDSYTVGLICNSSIELAAATIMLDELHADPLVHTGDQNTYTLGRIQGHNVVVACLPSGASGDAAAATVAAHMRLTFGAIRFHLMVGIGEGVPKCDTGVRQDDEDDDIRVGDIVVSCPTDSFGGVIRYDRGVRDGDSLRYTRALNKPPPELLTALSKLQADHEMGERKDIAFLSSTIPRQPDKFRFQGRQNDLLFQSDYDHIRTENTCRNCDNARLIKRNDRYTNDPKIHYGLIAFGNQPVNDGRTRDRLRQNHEIYCIDTGAAGLMDNTPCLVIRGIWSYADSHKNELWQGYAAAVAAAFAKELLSVTSVTRQGSSFADTVPCRTSVVNKPTPTTTLNTGTSSRPSKDSPEPLSDWLTMKPLDLRNIPAIPEFIGRQESLNDLWDFFSAGNSSMRKVAVLYGLGGIGKTQLAIHFARLHQNDFTRIFWVNGKSQKTLVDSLAEIEIPDSSVDPVNDVQKKAERVLRWLAIKGNSGWLLIFDDVDQYAISKINNEEAYDVNSYFPTADHGSIIITTRLRKLQELGQPFLVPKLNEKESMLLMKDIGHTPEEKEDISTLAFRLDGLPLAISLASSYIFRKGIEVSRYLHRYSESWRALQEHVTPHRQYSNGNMATTWMPSYNAIRKINNSYTKFLVLLSHFSHQDIRFELVQNALEFSRIPDWLYKIASDEQGFLNAIEALMDFCFIERGENGSFLMHPVVQTWCRNIDDIDKDELKTMALISISSFIPDPTTTEYCELQQRLLLHADEIYPFFQNGWEFPPDDEVLEAAHKIGILYQDQDEFDKAEVIYKSMLRGREETLGFNDVSTLDTVSQFGFDYHRQGKLENAEKMYTRALSDTHIFTLDTGSNRPFTLRSANNLGVLYMNQNKLQEAERMYELARSRYEKVPGLSHLHSLDTISNLGLLRRAQGNLREAEPLLQQALEGREKALGPDHASTLDAFNNLGTLYLDQDNLEKAESMYRRALDGREEPLGSKHTSTLDTVHNLGLLYQKRGKLELAESMYKRALEGREEALGSDHTSTLETVNNMGILYMEQGKWDDAMSMYQRALDGRKTVLGPDHLSTLATINNMAILYKNWGKLEQAETLCGQALSGYETALGSDHISTLDIVNNIGRIHYSQGQMNAAEMMYQRALNGYEKTLGQNHASTLNAINNLGNVYFEQDKLKEAEGMYRRVVSSGKSNLEALQAVGNLGVIREREGKLHKAKEIYLQELKGIEELLGKDHQETRMVKEKLRILKWKRLNPSFVWRIVYYIGS